MDRPKAQLARDLGTTHFGAELPAVGELDPNIIIECSGAAEVIIDFNGPA